MILTFLRVAYFHAVANGKIPVLSWLNRLPLCMQSNFSLTHHHVGNFCHSATSLLH